MSSACGDGGVTDNKYRCSGCQRCEMPSYCSMPRHASPVTTCSLPPQAQPPACCTLHLPCRGGMQRVTCTHAFVADALFLFSSQPHAGHDGRAAGHAAGRAQLPDAGADPTAPVCYAYAIPRHEAHYLPALFLVDLSFWRLCTRQGCLSCRLQRPVQHQPGLAPAPAPAADLHHGLTYQCALQFVLTIWRRVLLPHQAAHLNITAFPANADVLRIAEVLARAAGHGYSCAVMQQGAGPSVPLRSCHRKLPADPCLLQAGSTDGLRPARVTSVAGGTNSPDLAAMLPKSHRAARWCDSPLYQRTCSAGRLSRLSLIG